MPGIASAATSVVMAHVAAGTKTIRVGAGGVMLPNHAPLVIAEQFGTLAALHPGRIDLGLGRAPGTDLPAARALRRNLDNEANGFPRDVMELIRYFGPVEPGQQVQAVPGAGLDVPVWILGSSLYGAQLAAALGLPFAFASHFAPMAMEQALEIYRARFEPSGRLEAGVASVIAAPTADRRLCSPRCRGLRQPALGRPQLPPPVEFSRHVEPAARDRPLSARWLRLRGTPRIEACTIPAPMSYFAGQIHNHPARHGLPAEAVGRRVRSARRLSDIQVALYCGVEAR